MSSDEITVYFNVLFSQVAHCTTAIQTPELLPQYMATGSNHVISLGNSKYVILDKHLSCPRFMFFDL